MYKRIMFKIAVQLYKAELLYTIKNYKSEIIYEKNKL